MGERPPNTIRFPRNTPTGFLLCIHCRTHLAPLYDCLGSIEWPTPANGVIFRSAVNVRADRFGLFRHNIPMVYVRCNGCNRIIGEKIGVRDPPANRVYEGNYIFHLDHVLRWDGYDLRDPITSDLVLDNDGIP
ncbi:hypothetical protein F3Y22_tig00111388pilonHSYRG00124 [Hibiscus syriacus]|uniref:Yippee domain-containing protein n=1 Tax=Hibiscus syriacus TaxID=106335 RepID=A0A6A2YMA2_HIBSY|nr:hypothetical protein F3Y22_tig00111388pilonHSYRG00124 [Hibiscus syriacus]